jgi:hypothetical protein
MVLDGSAVLQLAVCGGFMRPEERRRLRHGHVRPTREG